MLLICVFRYLYVILTEKYEEKEEEGRINGLFHTLNFFTSSCKKKKKKKKKLKKIFEVLIIDEIDDRYSHRNQSDKKSII